MLNVLCNCGRMSPLTSSEIKMIRMNDGTLEIAVQCSKDFSADACGKTTIYQLKPVEGSGEEEKG